MSLSYFNVKKLRRQSKQDAASPSLAPASPNQEASASGQEASAQASNLPSVPTTAPADSKPAEEADAEEPVTSPILDDEDQRFLERLAAIAQEPEGTPPPLPNRPGMGAEEQGAAKGGIEQEMLAGGAEQVALPVSPAGGDVQEQGKADGEKAGGKKSAMLGYFALAQNRFRKAVEKDKDGDSDKKGKGKEKEKDSKKKDKASEKDKAAAAAALQEAADSAKTTTEAEAAKENEDLTQILDQLNLSAVNNRVFSFSKESEELLAKFKVVLKDLVNGVPTAYNDLEKLLTDSEGQLKKMYGNLPPFLQNLVKSLPTKISAALGPEILAAQAERPGFDAKKKGMGAAGKRKMGKPKMPSLKSLVSAEGAVATMLRSILSFLKLRFPALMTGTNVLLSLAVFLLLFVFWYCHKRGRETRLEKERLEAGDPGSSTLASSASSMSEGTTNVNEGDALPAESSSRAQAGSDEPAPPLILKDDKEGVVGVEDMPSVKHLPDPKDGAAGK